MTTTLDHLAVVTAPAGIGEDITQHGQLEWRGLVIGEGTFYCTNTLTGIESLPGVDRSSVARARRNGAYPGTVLAQERIINWSGSIFIDGQTTYDARQALIAATRIRSDAVEEPLVIRTDDVMLLGWAQVIARSIPLTTPYRRWVDNVELQWSCSDPLLYLLPDDGSTALEVGSRLPEPGSGMVYPLVYPLDYGTPGTSGDTTAENTGPEPTPGIFTIWGEATGPQINIVWPDGTRLSTTFDLDLGAGEFATVDAREGTVTLAGTANRNGSASGTPVEELYLAPGVNQISFRATSGDPATAELDVAWLPAQM